MSKIAGANAELKVKWFWFYAALACVALLTSESGAHAADPGQPFSWIGFYAGANIGYGWGRAASSLSLSNPHSDANLIPYAVANSDVEKAGGVIGGGQLGYNWQVLPHGIVGLETDWQGAGQRSNQAAFTNLLPVGPGSNTSVVMNNSSSILWFGTVRGRIGYAWDSLLIYGTGGLAYGDVKLAGTVNEALIYNGFPFGGASTFSVSKLNAGWTVGAGVEGALTNSWTWKIEYLYLDLGSIAASQTGPVPVFNETIAAQARFTDNILRVGFNFRFQ
jgi:outer membrane immunogenic protein